MKTCLIQLRIGDKVIFEPNGRHYELTIKDYKLVPNGMDDPKIVVLITAFDTERIIEATSDKFIIIDNENYESVYKFYNTK